MTEDYGKNGRLWEEDGRLREDDGKLTEDYGKMTVTEKDGRPEDEPNP